MHSYYFYSAIFNNSIRQVNVIKSMKILKKEIKLVLLKKKTILCIENAMESA